MEWTIEDRGGIEVWTIDGAARRNSITRAMLSELNEALRRASGKRELRCVVLAGAGDRAFCAGADLKERARMSAEDVHAFHRDLRAALRSIETSPRVFVAALNGAAGEFSKQAPAIARLVEQVTANQHVDTGDGSLDGLVRVTATKPGAAGVVTQTGDSGLIALGIPPSLPVIQITTEAGHKDAGPNVK